MWDCEGFAVQGDLAQQRVWSVTATPMAASLALQARPGSQVADGADPADAAGDVVGLVIGPAPEHRLEETGGFHDVEAALFQDAVDDVDADIAVSLHAGDVVDIDIYITHTCLLRPMKCRASNVKRDYWQAQRSRIDVFSMTFDDSSPCSFFFAANSIC